MQSQVPRPRRWEAVKHLRGRRAAKPLRQREVAYPLRWGRGVSYQVQWELGEGFHQRPECKGWQRLLTTRGAGRPQRPSMTARR